MAHAIRASPGFGALALLVGLTCVTSPMASALCSAATSTISDSAGASALSSCSTFSGSIAIATGTTDNIALDGIETITGNLIVDNVTQISSLSGDVLKTIGNTFTMNGLIILSIVNFPQLANVETISWNALPALQGLSFTTGVQNVSTISIQNTQLASVDGLNPTSIDNLLLANNYYLESVAAELENIKTSMIIEANGRNASANFPNLLWAYNITFNNVSSISLPLLAFSNGSFGVNGGLTESISLPNLNSIGGTFSIEGNGPLTTLSLPSLSIVGQDLAIINVTQVATIDLPQLKTVGGSLNCDGGFTNISFPALVSVTNDVAVYSSQNISSSCTSLQSQLGTRNHFRCDDASSINGTGTSPTSSSSSSGVSSPTTPVTSSSTAPSDGLSSGAKIGIGVGVGVGVLVLLAALGAVFFDRRRASIKAKQMPNQDAKEKDDTMKPELPADETAQVHELGQQHGESELGRSASGKQLTKEGRHEMAGEHGASELGPFQRHELP